MVCSKTKTLPGQSGFTLVELISVIVVVGVLVAIALPRFIGLSEDAHDAAVRSTAGSFREAISAHQAAWQARGRPLAVDGITMNANGFPGPLNPTTPDCIALWGMMDTSYGINTFVDFPSITVGAESWSTIGNGGGCIYVYDTDITPPRGFAYIPNDGTFTINVP